MPATTSQIAHLLSRTGARVNPARLAQLSKLELDEAVNQVCDFSQNPSFVIPKESDFDAEWKWFEAIRNQWLDRLATLPNPLEVKLTLFWHGHFAVSNSNDLPSPMISSSVINVDSLFCWAPERSTRVVRCRHS